MNDYELLRNVVNPKCPCESFDKVNQCIEIISGRNEREKEKKIKSLICYFEGKLNKSNFYAIVAIAYTLLLGGNALIKDDLAMELFWIVIIASVVVAILSLLEAKKDTKDTFILRVLNFKLEELNNKSKSSKGTDTINEEDSSDQVNTTNPGETMNYREYVVRVYDK